MQTSATPRARTILPTVALEEQGRRAGVVTRTLVMVVDAAIVAALLGMVYALWVGVVFMVGPDPFAWPHLPVVGGLSASYVICVLYLTAGWHGTGRSVGARLFAVRVVSRRGGRLWLGVAFVRAVLCTTFPVLLFWCAVSRQNRSVQDIVLRTSVIYDWQSHVPREEPKQQPKQEPTSPDDALGVGVDVAAAVAHEADDGESEALTRIDGE